MQVYLLRHGIAEDAAAGQSDASRQLTQEGRRKLRQVLDAAAEAGVQPSLILSSPLKRALQTAEIASDVLKYKNEIVRSNALTPNSSVEEAWDEIRVHRDETAIMAVGHNPLFSELAGFLIGSKTAQIDMKKGAILRVDLDSFTPHPKGMLRWYLTHKLAARSD